MSSLKEQRDKIFQDKLQELGDMGTKVRNEEDAPFYDKPVTSLTLSPKEKKEEEIIISKTKRKHFRQRSVSYYKGFLKNEAYAKNQRTQRFYLIIYLLFQQEEIFFLKKPHIYVRNQNIVLPLQCNQ